MILQASISNTKNMNTLIFICGVYSLAFAIFHIFFWRIFEWKNQLKKLSFVNRGIMQILNLQLTYFFLFVALICFLYPSALANTEIGNTFLAGISLFWLSRTVEQFIFFKTNNKYVQLLTIIFVAGAVLYALPVIL
jgi:hypothetical protein